MWGVKVSQQALIPHYLQESAVRSLFRRQIVVKVFVFHRNADVKDAVGLEAVDFLSVSEVFCSVWPLWRHPGRVGRNET